MVPTYQGDSQWNEQGRSFGVTGFSPAGPVREQFVLFVTACVWWAVIHGDLMIKFFIHNKEFGC